MKRNRHVLLICLLLVITTLAAYIQVGNYDFVNFDDHVYVTKNPYVQSGLAQKSIVWAFTSIEGGNWHPMTWLSHMLDCHLFGMNPGWHHLTNLFFHTANTLLLFLVLFMMTKNIWQSAFVAVLFSVHPLHVESVVWISERKDVLSTFFCLLTMLAYAFYRERPGWIRYLLTLLFFIMGLMAKPMLVTLPFVLLLIDYWPLGRLQPLFSNRSSESKNNKPSVFPIILEKAPFFIITAISCVVTFFVQQQAGAMSSMEIYGFEARIANALVSYIVYIGKMIWPYPLSVFYPHPGDLPLWKALGAALILLGLSVSFFRLSPRYPYFLVGWLWYLGTLVPVIGLVQVGGQAMADRYTYVPLIGLFVIIGWGIPDLVKTWHNRRMVLALFTGVLILCCMILTRSQVRHWKNAITLFDYTVKVTQKNALAHHTLGLALLKEGNLSEAVSHFYEALRIKPGYKGAHSDLGVAMARQGNFKEAVHHFREELRIRPEKNARAHHNLGMALRDLGNINESIVHLKEALRIKPDFTKAYYSLGTALKHQGNLEGAVENFQKALRTRPIDSNETNIMEVIDYSSETPDYAKIHFILAVVLAEQNRFDEAIEHYAESLRIRHDFFDAHCNLGVVFARQGNFKKAMVHLQDALRLRPDDEKVKNNMVKALWDFGLALRRDKKYQEAIAQFQKALRIRPDYPDARNELAVTYNNYGAVLGNKGYLNEAIVQFREALKLRPNYADAKKNLQIILDDQKKVVNDSD